MNSNSLAISAMASIALFTTGSLHASPLVEETFDYEAGNVSGSNGGTGFAGAWAATKNNPQVAAPGLTWGSLDAAGNAARGAAWSGLSRPIGSTLADAGLMNNGATLWFSAMFDLTGQNFSNADLNLSLGSSGFVPGTFGERENLVSGEGIGITHSGALIQGVYWQNNDADTIAERVENNSSLRINGVAPNLTYALIVGRIDWGADGTSNETLTLYAPDTTLALGEPIMAAWSIPALDQSQFTTLALQFKDTPLMDEIRFGATSADVMPVVSDTSIAITSFTAVGGGIWETVLEGQAETAYEFRSAVDLVFDPGTLVENLTQGDPGDPGMISGTNNSLLITDANGDGTVRMSLSGPANFVRAQTPLPLVLFEESFDTTAGPGLPTGWTQGRNDPPDDGLTSTTVWEVGTPVNVGPVPPGVPLPSGDQCVATGIGTNYFVPDPAGSGSPLTDIWLRTPVIDLGTSTEGTLTFQQWTAIEDVSGDLDYGSIRILDASDDSELAVIENRTIDGSTAGWEAYSTALPAAAFTATLGTIKVEFRFEADDLDSLAGWYIDDVSVTTPSL